MLKKRNTKGFTLAELLVVVAIIAILVAIAIPIFTSQTIKAKETADIANLRSIYAEASVDMISGKDKFPTVPADFLDYGNGKNVKWNYEDKFTIERDNQKAYDEAVKGGDADKIKESNEATKTYILKYDSEKADDWVQEIDVSTTK